MNDRCVARTTRDGMALLMSVEMALIGERGVAPLLGATIWFLPSVQPQMSFEITLLVEGRVASLVDADEVTHSLVLL